MMANSAYSARNKMQGEWSKGSLLPGSINDSINANYPYVLTDGATIYYAADGENSIGGYRHIRYPLQYEYQHSI